MVQDVPKLEEYVCETFFPFLQLSFVILPRFFKNSSLNEVRLSLC